MTEEDRLREALRDAVPEPGLVPDRAGAARTRAATKRRALTVLAAAGTVLLIAGVGAISFPGRDSLEPPAGSTKHVTVDPGALDCAPWSEDAGNGDEKLPLGALAARLCDPTTASGAPGFAMGWQAPKDLLTERLDELVSLINRQERPNLGGGCTDDAGPAYTLTLAYPDGSTRSVAGERYGCGFLRYGDTTRLGAEDVWQQIVTSWQAQRAETPPVDLDTTAPTCDQIGELYGPQGIRFSPFSRWDQVVEARVCRARIGIEGPYGWEGKPVPSDMLRELTVSYVADRQRIDGLECSPERQDLTFALIGTTAWGDHVRVETGCLSVWPGSTPDEAWTPPARLVAGLTTLLASSG